MDIEELIKSLKSIRDELICDPRYKRDDDYIMGIGDGLDVAIQKGEAE